METKRFQNLYVALTLFILAVVTGIVGYMYLEDFTFVEAVYMTIITMSTVGFGEVRELSDIGRVFTAFLIIFSFGIFAYVFGAITRYFLDGELRQYLKNYKVNKRLEKLQNHVIVCGYGRTGQQAVDELLEHDEMVVVIEKNEQVISEMPAHYSLIVLHGDTSQDEILQKARLDKAKALVSTLPADADNLLVVLTAREMNPKIDIIARGVDERSESKLKRAGANNVIMPERIGGIRMAKLVAQPDIVEFIETILLRSEGKSVNLAEIFCRDLRSCFINKTIGELDIRKMSGANLIGLKTDAGHYIFNPAPNIKIRRSDKLFALGTPQQIEKLKEVLGTEG